MPSIDACFLSSAPTSWKNSTIPPKPITIIAYAKQKGWISMKMAERKKTSSKNEKNEANARALVNAMKRMLAQQKTLIYEMFA